MSRSWAAAAAVLVLGLLPISSAEDHILTYGPQQETLYTLEGEERSTPHVYRQKFKRFLSFNNDASNIRVEMVFAVPFLHIPIGGKTVEGPYGNGVTPVVDINAKSLLTASVLLLMLFFVIPKIVRVFVPTAPQARAFEEGEVSRVIRGVEEVFHVNSTACWQQGVCSLVQAGRRNIHSDHPSSWGKVVDGVSSLKWVEKTMAGTWLGEAVSSAKQDNDGCKVFYNQCPLSPDKLTHFTKELARRYMNHLIHLHNTNTVK
ncbi:uncharacterized protein LOC128987532 [Macrosteles quadrilineatus]|uniref:uncharacterized protein LOC128987532 n=1 Tax=Macrosteles quadrilineatus TaxID=74068 RepID=UPI0023E1A6CC|nr:uncharacterized protein LOC128987532 [Macrosteles quadrilineatus]